MYDRMYCMCRSNVALRTLELESDYSTCDLYTLVQAGRPTTEFESTCISYGVIPSNKEATSTRFGNLWASVAYTMLDNKSQAEL